MTRTRTNTTITPTTIAAAAAERTAETSTASKAAPCAIPETSPASETSSKSTATAKAGGSLREAIFTDFEKTTLPVISVELSDCVTGVFRELECNDARTFRAAIGSNVDVGANDGTLGSCKKG